MSTHPGYRGHVTTIYSEKITVESGNWRNAESTTVYLMVRGPRGSQRERLRLTPTHALRLADHLRAAAEESDPPPAPTTG